MTPSRPYLLRAIYEWIVDNGCTPHLLVDAAQQGCVVPGQFVKDGAIVLNVNPSAVQDLSLGNEFVMFRARFSGVAREITVPISAIRAIYARENGQGMAFDDEETPPPQPDGDGPQPPDTSPKDKPPPRLSLVK